MSIGVNVLLKVLPELTRALGEKYDIEMVELHHNRKKDSPSGTALRLGECLAEARGWDLDDVRCSARDGIIGERPKAQIGIQAIRGGEHLPPVASCRKPAGPAGGRDVPESRTAGRHVLPQDL